MNERPRLNTEKPAPLRMEDPSSPKKTLLNESEYFYGLETPDTDSQRNPKYILPIYTDQSQVSKARGKGLKEKSEFSIESQYSVKINQDSHTNQTLSKTIKNHVKIPQLKPSISNLPPKQKKGCPPVKIAYLVSLSLAVLCLISLLYILLQVDNSNSYYWIWYIIPVLLLTSSILTFYFCLVNKANCKEVKDSKNTTILNLKERKNMKKLRFESNDKHSDTRIDKNSKVPEERRLNRFAKTQVRTSKPNLGNHLLWKDDELNISEEMTSATAMTKKVNPVDSDLPIYEGYKSGGLWKKKKIGKPIRIETYYPVLSKYSGKSKITSSSSQNLNTMTNKENKTPISFQNFCFDVVETEREQDGIRTKARVIKQNPYLIKPAEVLPDDIKPVRDQETDAPEEGNYIPTINLPQAIKKPEIKEKKYGLVQTKQYSVYETFSKMDPDWVDASMRFSKLLNNPQNLNQIDEPHIQKPTRAKSTEFKRRKFTYKKKRTNLAEDARTSLTQKQPRNRNQDISKKVKIAEGDRGVSFYKNGIETERGGNFSARLGLQSHHSD